MNIVHKYIIDVPIGAVLVIKKSLAHFSGYFVRMSLNNNQS